MTPTQRRRAQRRLADERKAAGIFIPRPTKSHYLTTDIRDVVTDGIQAQRDMMAAHRHVAMDPTWQWDQAIWKAEDEAQKETRRV